MKRLFLLLPFLFAIAPVVELYASNSGQARFHDTWLPLAAVTTATLVLLPLCRMLTRSWIKGAVLLSVCWLLIFSYGHAAKIIGRHVIAGHNPGNYKFLVSCMLAIMIACVIALRRSRSDPVRLATVLLVMAAGMLLTSAAAIARFQRSAHTAASSAVLPAEALTAGRVLRRPDIYYVILDRYAAARTLASRYQLDNRPFISFLRERGFYVADESRGNYLPTAQSLASSLNMAHILPLESAIGKESSDWQPVFDLIEGNRLALFLKTQGYKYIHMGPDWKPTKCNSHADVCYSYGGLPDFSMTLLTTTAFYPVLYRLGINNGDRAKFAGVKRQLDTIPTLTHGEESPKFVFVHILVPHGPFVFNHDGTYREPVVANAHSEPENYIEQVEFITARMRTLVREIQEAYPADQPPVIVVQGDEGPYPTRTQPHSFDWAQVTDEEINEKMRILDAIYAPGCEPALYPAMTPVNTFRVILNHFFSTGLPLLPDRSYTYRDLRHLYNFIDVTKRLDNFQG